MPLGRFRDFGHCVEEIMKSGREREEALKICGALEKEPEKKDVENSVHGKDENDKVKKKKKIDVNKEMEETTYGEPCGIINYELEELDERGKKI